MTNPLPKVLMDVGGEVDLQALAAASLTFTPIADRAAIVSRIAATNVSANDVLRVFVGGQEVQAFRVMTNGTQNMLGQPDNESVAPGLGYDDIYDWFEQRDDPSMWVPVPQSMPFLIKFDGAATADLSIVYFEVAPSAIRANMANHPQGTTIVSPVYAYRAAAAAATGDNQLDTVIKPTFAPDFITGITPFPAGWSVEVLALFIEAGGVNAYAAATDHRSRTKHLRIMRKGTFMFTRTYEGLVALGLASAAGSANKNYGTESGKYPAFVSSRRRTRNKVPFWPALMPGENPQWFLNITGDVGAGADYSTFSVALICKFKSSQPFSPMNLNG